MERRKFLKGVAIASIMGAGATSVFAKGSEFLSKKTIFDNTSSEKSETQIYEWTILSTKVTAKAWTDSNFKKFLFENPNSAVLSICKSKPSGLNLKIVEETVDTRYLVLPYKKDKFNNWNSEYFLSVAENETGNDNSLEYFLPASVVKEAFYNNKYRKELIQNPKAAIEKLGIVTGKNKIKILENTANLNHLVLHQNPIHQENLSFDVLAKRLNVSMQIQ